jgi:hypothetical protein
VETFVQCLFSARHLIGDNGTVKRLDQGKIKRYGTDVLIGLVKPEGYKMYYINGKWYYAHRLVLMHFVPNPGNLSDANHKDGVKSNNHVSNLEWLSHSANCQHRYTVLGKAAPKGKDHHNYGKTASAEARDNMSNAKKGWKRNGFSGRWIKP